MKYNLNTQKTPDFIFITFIFSKLKNTKLCHDNVNLSRNANFYKCVVSVDRTLAGLMVCISALPGKIDLNLKLKASKALIVKSGIKQAIIIKVEPAQKVADDNKLL